MSKTLNTKYVEVDANKILNNLWTTSSYPPHYEPYSIASATTNKNVRYGGYLKEKDVYIKQVIYNNPATIVFWSDNTKTVAKCRENDVYSKECGLAICTLKKILGGTQVLRLFDDWVSEYNSITLKDVRKMYYD